MTNEKTTKPVFPDLYRLIREASPRIRSTVRETPLEYSDLLSCSSQCKAWLKCENLQVTGSFKIRGAANSILASSQSGRIYMTASSGNHGAAVAYMLRRLGLEGIITLPETAASAKVERIRRTGVQVVLHGYDCIEAEAYAREEAGRKEYYYIPPYNDEYIIAGQGTIGAELVEQAEAIDCILVPVGGGGLISGLAVYLKNRNPGIEIIGCQPEASAVMARSVEAGTIIEEVMRPTLADGVAGGIEQNALTFDVCKALVDDFILVDEDILADSLIRILEHHHMLIEGAAALPVAALLQSADRFRDKRVIVILSGANLGIDRLKAVLNS